MEGGMSEMPSNDLAKITELTEAEAEAVAGGIGPRAVLGGIAAGVGIVVGGITIVEKAYGAGKYVGSKIP